MKEQESDDSLAKAAGRPGTNASGSMSPTRTTGRRAAENIVIIYSRSLVVMVLTLLSARYVLSALGTQDYGVFVVAAGVSLFLSFITGAMTTSTQRALAMRINARDSESACRAFNATLTLHLCLGLGILLIGETVGLWFLKNVLVIPAGRIGAATLVLHLTVASSALGAALVPYEALLQAYERFGFFSALGVLQALIMLVFSVWLKAFQGDRLVVYGGLVAAVSCLTPVVGAIVARLVITEARIRFHDLSTWQLLGDQVNFFKWNLVGGLASVMRSQGVAFLMNILFGPNGSAAYGIASQVSNGVRQIAQAITGALGPPLYKLEAAGHRDRMVGFALLASKYAFLATAVVAIPLLAEMPMILKLWLGSPPPAAAMVCQVMLAIAVLDQLSGALGIAFLAIGKIAAYQLLCGLVAISSIPLGYWLGITGGDEFEVLLAVAVTTLVVVILRVVLLRSYAHQVMRAWIRDTALPGLLAIAPALGLGTLVGAFVEPNVGRLMLTAVLSVAAGVLGILFVGVNGQEREWLTSLAFRRNDAM